MTTRSQGGDETVLIKVKRQGVGGVMAKRGKG